KESVFSDLNNLKVVTTTSGEYADCFGFTEEEVFAALEEFGLSSQRCQVKNWYDGFIFGNKKDIYNPWSIINFLNEKRVGAYWANTSSNSLVGKLIREGSSDIKKTFEHLLQGESIRMEIDEQIIYDQLSSKRDAVWSLLLASGYLKVINLETYTTSYGEWKEEYELGLTNFEVWVMFRKMVRGWFEGF
ncbi:MAG: AAA family ATPase, partial [Lachnospiraceae bacterium]|nr:AAA family ATPase [Lachnospiraceae bacterium]